MKEGDKYQCSDCKKTYQTTWTDEEALAEAAMIFGDVPKEKLTVVCDECYRKSISRLKRRLS
jgi:hypothetical protein